VSKGAQEIRIHTEHLILRPLAPSDEAVFFEIESHPEIGPLIHGTADPEESRRRLLDSIACLARDGHGFLAIELAGTRQMIGIGGLLRYDFYDDLHVLIAILPKSQRKGFGKEAMRALLDWGFNGLHRSRILGLVWVGNVPSLSLIVGFRPSELGPPPVIDERRPEVLYEFRPPIP